CTAPPTKHPRATAATAASERHSVAVTVDHTDAVERNAEEIGQHLRISGRVTHPEVERTTYDGHRAVGFEVGGAEFLPGCCTHLEIAAHSKSAQQATLLAFTFAFLE